MVETKHPRLVVGFCGKAGAGKSTAAAEVFSNRPTMRVVPFAGPLKAMLRTLADLGPDPVGHMLYNPDFKELPTEALGGNSPRHAMQTLGTEWGRACMGEDFWVNMWLRQVGGDSVVADDIRFQNEADAIHALGGVVIEVRRKGLSDVRSHPSEHGVAPDVFVHNDGTFDELRKTVNAVLEGHLRGKVA